MHLGVYIRLDLLSKLNKLYELYELGLLVLSSFLTLILFFDFIRPCKDCFRPHTSPAAEQTMKIIFLCSVSTSVDCCQRAGQLKVIIAISLDKFKC